MATETHEAASEMAHDAAQAAGHATESVGMPQLDFATFGNQIFWLLVTLVVIWWVLSRIALPRIGAVLADRQATIAGDLSAAEDYKAKAKDAEAAYEKALADARTQAQKIVAESQSRIADIRAGALEAVEAVAKTSAADIVAAFGGKADAKTIGAAIGARLKG